MRRCRFPLWTERATCVCRHPILHPGHVEMLILKLTDEGQSKCHSCLMPFSLVKCISTQCVPRCKCFSHGSQAMGLSPKGPAHTQCYSYVHSATISKAGPFRWIFLRLCSVSWRITFDDTVFFHTPVKLLNSSTCPPLHAVRSMLVIHKQTLQYLPNLTPFTRFTCKVAL